MKLRLILAALILGALAFSGCTQVQPWQRGALASYEMNPDRDQVATAMSEHIYFSREGASGGRGVGGSGCGCN
ncbi:MAG TPA: DUF4266 domain-containing protein [Opitutaceae bacterium]